MLKSAKRNKISPLSLFYILFICRVSVSLASIHSVSKSEITSSTVVAYLLAVLLTVLLSYPAVLCARFDKNPIETKTLGKFYCAYFIFINALSVSRFSHFASTTLNPETQGWLFVLIICLCAFYSATLGIEAISRFSAFCFVLLFSGILSVLFCNFNTFDEINFYPLEMTTKSNLFENAFTFASNTSEIAIFLSIYQRVNGRVERSFVRSVCLSFFAVLMLLYVALGVMGDSMSVRSFPFYSFFQISKFGTFERLDVLHMSFWIMSVFVKSSICVYSACTSFSKNVSGKNSLVVSILTFTLSLVLLKFNSFESVIMNASMLTFVLFCVLLPVLTLIFKRKNYGDELVKMY